MKTNKIKINFHGKERSLLESKLILFGLKTNLISLNLNKEEKENYLNYQDSAKKTFWKPSSEREYLIRELDSAIGLTEIIKSKDYCKKHGHKKRIKIPFISGEDSPTRIYCRKCGTYYQTGAYGQEI